ncbi:CAAX prenyl protease 2 [Galdieria sulphuraria]|nr:CAAX prenyl protease 2 [Galdieria sulphuraria]
MNLEHCLWFSCSFSLFLCTTFVGLLYLPWFYGERNDCKIIKRRSLALLSLGTFFYSVTDFVIISYLFELNEEQKKLVRTSSLANFFDSFSPILLLFLGPFSLNIIEIVTYYLRGVSIEESLKLSLPLLGQDSWIIRLYLNFVYNSLRTAILETVIQFSYTFLFGVYSAWVFIRSRRVITSICLHSFCNFVGTPDLSKIWSHCYRWPLLLTYFIGISLFLHSVFHVS